MSWFLLALKKYATFSGRASRSEYWYFVLFFFLIVFAASLVDVLLGSYNEREDLGILSGIVVLALFLPTLAVSARRLHDVGRSGWWQLLGGVPIIGFIVLLVWYVSDSDPQPNEFGPNPKGAA